MRHIISVTDIRHLQSCQILAFILTNREQIGQCLTGMQKIAEGIDHGNVRIPCQFLDTIMPIGTDHDAVQIT